MSIEDDVKALREACRAYHAGDTQWMTRVPLRPLERVLEAALRSESRAAELRAWREWYDELEAFGLQVSDDGVHWVSADA